MMRYGLAALLSVVAVPAGAETVAITGARTWTMTMDGPVENATIIVKDGGIVSVAAGGAVPAGARVVAAAGHVVTPALIHPATQVGLGEVGAIAEEHGMSVTRGALGAAFNVEYAFDSANQAIRQARADGLAHATVYPGGSGSAPFDGIAAIIRLGSATATVERSRSAMFATIGGAAGATVGGSRAAAWQLLRNALDEARSYRRGKNGGVARDQILNHLDVEALAPVLAGTMPLVLAINRASDIRQAVALARDYRLRIVVYGGAEAWVEASALAAAHVPVILQPISILPENYDSIGTRRDNAVILVRAGVRVAFSVSAHGIHRSWNAASSLREGAGDAVAAGLPYHAALAAITVDAGRVMGLPATAGTLAPGADADLVIWDGDPLEPATAPLHVFARGLEISLVTRQTLLRDRYAPRR